MPPQLPTVPDISQTAKFGEGIKQSGIVILVIAAMIVLVLVVIYIVNMVRKTKLQNVVLQTNLIATDNRSVVPFTVPAGNMSLITNGQEFSYSFWIFLGGNYQPTNGYKMIMQRGNTNSYTGTLLQISSTTNPIILMDPASNKMYFAVATNAAKNTAANLTPAQILATDSKGQYTSGYLVTYIDYVPLQRWVNIALVIKNTAIYVYMDADLYSVVSLSDISPQTSAGQGAIIQGTAGDLLIGDSVNNTPGYISLARFFNYAIGQPDLQTLYNSGPALSSWLSYVGLGNYAVRSPIYEIA
jgi:hypothetical protein